MLSSRPNDRGFTIIELAVILLIVSIVMSVVLISWPRSTIDKNKLNAQAELLANNIRYTQNLAMTKAEYHWLSISIPNSSYQIFNTSSPTKAIIMPTGESEIKLNDENKNKIEISTNLPKKLIAFDGKGIPYIDSDVATRLSEIATGEAATIRLISNSNVETISIAPETGWVKVS